MADLHRASQHANITVATCSHATRLLFRDRDAAAGVECMQGTRCIAPTPIKR